MRPRIHVADALAPVAGPLLAAALSDAVARAGRCRVAVSGGGTPGPVFAWVAEHLAPATQRALAFTLTDERHLPLGPADGWLRYPRGSNLRALADAWLTPAGITPEQVLPLSTGGDLDRDAAAASAAFTDRFDGLDVVVLGVGPDGHIASLFPEHPALDAAGPVVAVRGSPKPPPERLSLSLPVLAAARVTILLATGAGKAEVLRRASEGDRALPLGRLTPSGAVHWVVDAAAASRLETR